MGTRGLTGYAVDGQTVAAYQQYDSYPSGVGVQVLAAARAIAQDTDRFTALARNIRKVDESANATPEDREKFAQYADSRVSTGTDYYSLLRNLQGDLLGYLNAGIIPENTGFAQDSLFCEWAYIVDMDARTFEVYEGFQTEQHSEGRFATTEEPELPYTGATERYYPVKLVKTFALDALPSDEQFLAELEPVEA